MLNWWMSRVYRSGEMFFFYKQWITHFFFGTAHSADWSISTTSDVFETSFLLNFVYIMLDFFTFYLIETIMAVRMPGHRVHKVLVGEQETRPPGVTFRAWLTSGHRINCKRMNGLCYFLLKYVARMIQLTFRHVYGPRECVQWATATLKTLYTCMKKISKNKTFACETVTFERRDGVS